VVARFTSPVPRGGTDAVPRHVRSALPGRRGGVLRIDRRSPATPSVRHRAVASDSVLTADSDHQYGRIDPSPSYRLTSHGNRPPIRSSMRVIRRSGRFWSSRRRSYPLAYRTDDALVHGDSSFVGVASSNLIYSRTVWIVVRYRLRRRTTHRPRVPWIFSTWFDRRVTGGCIWPSVAVQRAPERSRRSRSRPCRRPDRS
jgi:hypothetical protein